MIFEEPSEVTEVLATPDETGDRYQLRLTVRPGGGPGVRGFGLHFHPGLIEIFHCISGSMTARLGRRISALSPGERMDVPAGIVHGFKNSGGVPLVVEVDMIFTPPFPRPEADLMAVGLAMSERAQAGVYSRGRGYPPLLHMAVIEQAHPQAMKHPGLAGLIMPGLAYLGRLCGHTPTASRSLKPNRGTREAKSVLPPFHRRGQTPIETPSAPADGREE